MTRSVLDWLIDLKKILASFLVIYKLFLHIDSSYCPNSLDYLCSFITYSKMSLWYNIFSQIGVRGYF